MASLDDQGPEPCSSECHPRILHQNLLGCSEKYRFPGSAPDHLSQSLWGQEPKNLYEYELLGDFEIHYSFQTTILEDTRYKMLVHKHHKPNTVFP